MARPDGYVTALAARQAAIINALARAMFAKLWETLTANPSLDAREAIQAAQVEFGGKFAEQLAEAFSDLLERSIGVASVLALPVGGLALSSRIYAHHEETAREVLEVIRMHLQGVAQARELALRLYDGYDPKDGIRRPLEGPARGELPRALRMLTADKAARESLAQIVEEGQQSAARLRTQALRAAYAEAFEAWERGAGEDALKRRLWVAQREKNRYFANRIAQTEIARAHQAQVAAELMADDTIEVVEVRINPAHPKRDICDLHARADLWGLGPGRYPKAKAPQTPFHPFCWCRLRSRPSLSAASAREVPDGEAAYLRTLTPLQAAGVMGSRDKAAEIETGADFASVVNRNKDPMYHLARLGDRPRHPLVDGPTQAP